MLDWTDRHCRFLHRQLSSRAWLFTEMITSAAIKHGDTEKLLTFDEREHPVAVQLGGANPDELATATRICTQLGYDEINLNVGCPSDRVQSGNFGACLMTSPQLVAQCVTAMKSATDRPVSVKCRIGIDDQDIEEPLDRLADELVKAGLDALYVHARKAWLNGLSPKDNRTIPPLNYERVHRLAARLKSTPVIINGGIENLEQAEAELKHVSGVMLGRAAYHNPMLLTEVDRRLFGDETPPPDPREISRVMIEYAESHLVAGGRLNNVTRHMLGLAHGLPGARHFRQILTMDVLQKGAGPEVIARAFDAVDFAPKAGGDKT